MPVGSKPSYCASLRLNRELSSAPATSAVRNSVAGAAAGELRRSQRRREQRGADVRARRHRVAEVQRAAHRAVQLGRSAGRQPVAVDQDRRLGRPSGLDEQFPQRQDAVLGRAREARAGHGHHHPPHDALGLGGDRRQAQAGDEFSQGVFELAHELGSVSAMGRLAPG